MLAISTAARPWQNSIVGQPCDEITVDPDWRERSCQIASTTTIMFCENDSCGNAMMTDTTPNPFLEQTGLLTRRIESRAESIPRWATHHSAHLPARYKRIGSTAGTRRNRIPPRDPGGLNPPSARGTDRARKLQTLAPDKRRSLDLVDAPGQLRNFCAQIMVRDREKTVVSRLLLGN